MSVELPPIILNALLSLDQQLFFFINQGLRNSFFDMIMPYLRNRNSWLPLYALIAVYVIWKYRMGSIIILFWIGITVLITDQIASSLIKPAVARLRPCNDPAIMPNLHLLTDCGSGFSFVSSHASNHFGLAFFLIVLLRRKFPWIIPAAILWATLVCFAQIYVGLHYPADMMGGALLGALTGIVTARLCKTSMRKFRTEPG